MDRDWNSNCQIVTKWCLENLLVFRLVGFALMVCFWTCLHKKNCWFNLLQATLLNLGIKGCGLLVNLQGMDNLPTKDKIPVPNVCLIQRFHCIYIVLYSFHSLDLSEFISTPSDSQPHYELYAVIDHQGSIHGGHCELWDLCVAWHFYISLIPYRYCHGQT